MITESQIKNVVTYYFLNMQEKKCENSIPIPTHVVRDTMNFNKIRADICGAAYNNEKFKDIFNILHYTVRVEQVNCTPQNTFCFVEKSKIPLSKSGIQLICKKDDDTVKHIVIQKRYQKICNAYFRLRHFTDILQETIKQWLIKQPWYLPNCYKVNDLLHRLVNSTICLGIFKNMVNLVETLEAI